MLTYVIRQTELDRNPAPEDRVAKVYRLREEIERFEMAISGAGTEDARRLRQQHGLRNLIEHVLITRQELEAWQRLINGG